MVVFPFILIVQVVPNCAKHHKRIVFVRLYLLTYLFPGPRKVFLLLEKQDLGLHKMKFSIKDFFSKYGQICSFVRIWSHFSEEILNGKLHFLCSWNVRMPACNTSEIIAEEYASESPLKDIHNKGSILA